jgi:hypothetical protein
MWLFAACSAVPPHALCSAQPLTSPAPACLSRIQTLQNCRPPSVTGNLLMSPFIPCFVPKYRPECTPDDEVGGNSKQRHAAIYIEYRLFRLGLFTLLALSTIGLRYWLLLPRPRNTLARFLCPFLPANYPDEPYCKPAGRLPSTWYMQQHVKGRTNDLFSRSPHLHLNAATVPLPQQRRRTHRPRSAL